MSTATKEKEWWLYGLVNPRTGSIRYCGQSCQPKRRANAHKRKYPSLEMRQMGVCDSEMEVLMWEFLFVEILQPPLNTIAGGGSNPVSNPETRKKISESLKKWYKENPDTAERYKKERIDFYRKNPDTLKRITDSRIGSDIWKKSIKRRTESTTWKNAQKKAGKSRAQNHQWQKRIREGFKKQGKPVRATCIVSGKVLEFWGQHEAARQMSERYKKNFCFQGISNVCGGKRNSHHGWRFEFA